MPGEADVTAVRSRSNATGGRRVTGYDNQEWRRDRPDLWVSIFFERSRSRNFVRRYIKETVCFVLYSSGRDRQIVYHGDPRRSGAPGFLLMICLPAAPKLRAVY